MNTVIKIKEKKYHVKVGEVIKVNGIKCIKNQVINIKESVCYDKILNNEEKVIVKTKVLEHNKEKKKTIFKKKRRKNYQRTIGENKSITFLKIKKII